MSKSKSEASPLDASNTPSLPGYHPTHLATAINFTYPTPLQGGVATSRGRTHLAAAAAAGSGAAGSRGRKGMYPSSPSQQPSSDTSQPGGISMSNLSNQFLGQSQPGFPASCFRVKGHDGGGGPTAVMVATTSSESSSTISGTNSYSNCLGPDWPDLGITLGQASKSQTKVPLVPSLGTAVGQTVNSQNKVVAPPPPPPGPQLGGTAVSLNPQNKVVAHPGAQLRGMAVSLNPQNKVLAHPGAGPPKLGGTAVGQAVNAQNQELGTASAKTVPVTTGAVTTLPESEATCGPWKASSTGSGVSS